MEIISVCSPPSPIAQGVAIGIVLAPFVLMIARSRHRERFLGIIAIMAALGMCSTTLSILTYLAEDDVPFIVGTTAVIAALAFAGKLIRSFSAPSRDDALKSVC